MTAQNAFPGPQDHLPPANAAPPARRPATPRRLGELENELTQTRKALRQLQRQQKRRESSAVAGAPGDTQEGWLTTYLDMLTLLLVLLVVMLAFAGDGDNSEPGDSGAAREPALAIADPDHGVLPDSLNVGDLGNDVEVIVNEKSVSFRIASEILFASGQADLSLDGLAVLKKLIPVLESTEHQIAIEGHTDSVPVRGGRYPSNWELSGARAGSVVRYLEANGLPSTRLRAVGFADTRPLADNTSEQGRARNRRVEMVMELPGKP